MGQYSIKDIETLSGIKAHTLRIWEQRYDLFKPERTDTNIRYYCDEQLKLILNVAALNKNGYKISRIAQMQPSEISEDVLRLSSTDSGSEAMLNALITAMIEFDEALFEKTLNSAIISLGFEKSFSEILFPFMIRTGTLWTTGIIKPVQEHFVSNLIRRKLCVAIDGQYSNKGKNAKKFVLFLPEGEWHELLLLFTDYILRSNHQDVVYIGSSLPLADIESLYTVFKPDYLLTYLTAPLRDTNTHDFIDWICSSNPKATVLIGGKQVDPSKIKIPSNGLYLSDLESLKDLVHKIKLTS